MIINGIELVAITIVNPEDGNLLTFDQGTAPGIFIPESAQCLVDPISFFKTSYFTESEIISPILPCMASQ